MIKAPKKLIEVALPLDDINAAAAREKSIRHGHPSTLHLWWARRPLAAARAVIFAQMVNDPGGERGWAKGLTKAQAAAKREYLFGIIRDLVKWENTNNEEVLERARNAIRESWRETCAMNSGKPGFDPNKLPAFHDPFAGGGAIPLEAQRLGLESYASDLNPVAVMINKAMIEIPPKFAGRAPIGPVPTGESEDCANDWKDARGLAEDVRRYGYWMREEAKKRIGHLYPQVEITKEMAAARPDLKQYVGRKLTVIAWLWARTVKSPNPQFSDVDVPLASSFILSSKKGKEAYVEPIVEGNSYRFEVKVGKPPAGADMGTKLGRGAKFKCLMSGTPMEPEYLRQEGLAKRMGARLMAIVAEGVRGRVYLNPLPEHEEVARAQSPKWKPSTPLPNDPRNFWTPNYGLNTYGELFTDRQLVALNTFSDLVKDAQARATADAKAAGWEDDGKPLSEGGTGATAYGDAIAVYLTFAVDRIADRGSTISSWDSSAQKIRNTFGRQAIPMAWDYAESNVFSDSTGNWLSMVDWVVETVFNLPTNIFGYASQEDAQRQLISRGKLLSTDPPYYDNIGYADLSDFFYVWLKRSLKDTFPSLFSTMTTPKAEELVATPYRHGSKDNAESFFMQGMTSAMHNIAELSCVAFPVTIYYAFKQSDTNELGTSNAGWETFLEAVISAGFAITGTWPMRTELANRMIGSGTNALASSIVLVCRKRYKDAETISRAQFNRELRAVMFDALEDMTNVEGAHTGIAAVDLAQAAIGPGMGVYSKYAAVLKSDGSKLSVHEAMIEINKEIDRFLHPDGQSYDPSTNFFVTWFETHGFDEGPFGEADVLARAKGTTVNYVVASEVAESKGGKMRILHYSEYPDDRNYNPKEDANLPLWEACHRVIRELEKRNRRAAATLLSKMPEKAADIRQLAYYLFTYCEKHGDAANARAYNALITSWSEITALMGEMAETPTGKHTQTEFGY